MPNLGNVPRPAYVYDTETDTWVPIGVGAHTHDDLYINQTVIDAKGDLLVGTADNSYARLAKGADGTVLVADNTTQTGLAWQPYAAQHVAGKNFVINGGFDIWQRGTSFANPNNVYTTDRWFNATNSSTVTRQSTGAPDGSRYYYRTTATGNGAYTDFYYFFETSQIAPLWGKTVTYSYKVRKNGTAFVGNFILTLQKSSTIDAGYGASWTTIANTITASENIASGTSSSNWTTVSTTVTIPNDGTANSLRFIGGYNNAQSSGHIMDLAQVQLEIGPTVTPFSMAGGNIQGELAACQRYYVRYTGGRPYSSYGQGFARSSGSADILFNSPVEMRVIPTSVEYSNIILNIPGGAGATITGITVSDQNTPRIGVSNVSSVVTAGQNYFLTNNNNTAGYIGFSAELA